jgi:transposase
VKADVEVTAELKQLRDLQRRYDLLKEEHVLLKKAIRFASERRQRSLRSSKQTGKNTKSR